MKIRMHTPVNQYLKNSNQTSAESAPTVGCNEIKTDSHKTDVANFGRNELFSAIIKSNNRARDFGSL